MQTKEAFKLGFLTRCVEEGLSPEQTHALAKMAAEQLEKRSGLPFAATAMSALDWLSKQSPIKSTTDAYKGVVDSASATLPLVAAGLAVPPAIGGLAAYLHNRSTDVDATDIGQVKQKELADTYRRMADQLNRQKQLRDYKQERKRTGRVYL